MAEDDDQDIFDSLEREASEFTKVGALELPRCARPRARLELTREFRMRRSTVFARHFPLIRTLPKLP